MAPPIDPLASIEPLAPQGAVLAIGLPNSQDYPRLVFAAPYHTTVAIADIIEPSVLEAVEGMLPTLVPPYVQDAANQAVQQLAVLLTGSTMTGPLYLNGLPTQPTQAADKSYVDMMVATAGVPEVPPVPAGQSWVRQTGQWAPISPQTGVFLPLSGGTMTGNVAMSGNTINGLAAVPNFPSGAAPAQWVLNQIAAVSLYQGTWNADTNVPDLTSGALHVNGYMWIVRTVAPGGLVVSQPILGLQGMTVYNGDTVIYSTVEGKFDPIHAGGLTAPQADARYVMLTGSQMSGALLLNANATAPLQAVTLQQLQAFVPTGSLPESPADGQVYGRNGQTHVWSPALPLVGGILTGALTLPGNAAQPLNAVPLQQLTSTLGAYVPLAGNVTVTGSLTMGVAATFTLGANAAAALQAVPLQQLTSTLASYASINSPVFTGNPTAPTPAPGDADTSLSTTAFVQAAVTGPAAQTNVGRNLVHNSMFNIAQRGAGPVATTGYLLDRWIYSLVGGTLSQAQIGLVDADRAAIGDESAKFAFQNACSGQAAVGDSAQLTHILEDVRRLSGKTVTLSFWAKATAGTPKVAIELYQGFGTGGSPSAIVTAIGTQAFTLSTGWTRYTSTPIAIPSTAGKTLGTTPGTDTLSLVFWQSAGSNNAVRASSIGIQNYTLQLWGVQLEIGSAATPLEKPDPQTDFAKCQRFYQVGSAFLTGYSLAGGSFGAGVSLALMRTTPTITFNNAGGVNLGAVTAAGNSLGSFYVFATATATGQPTQINGSYTASADL